MQAMTSASSAYPRRMASLSSLFGGSSAASTRPPSYSSFPAEDLPAPPPPYQPVRALTPAQQQSQSTPLLNKPSRYPPTAPDRIDFLALPSMTALQRKLTAWAVIQLAVFLAMAAQIHVICSAYSRSHATCRSALPSLSAWIEKEFTNPGAQNAALVAVLLAPFAAYAAVDVLAARKLVAVAAAMRIELALVATGSGYYAAHVAGNARVLVAAANDAGWAPAAVAAASVLAAGLAVIAVVYAARIMHALHLVAVTIEGNALTVRLPFRSTTYDDIVAHEHVADDDALDLVLVPPLAAVGAGLRSVRLVSQSKPAVVVALDAPGFARALDALVEWNAACAEVVVTAGTCAQSSAVRLPRVASLVADEGLGSARRRSTSSVAADLADTSTTPLVVDLTVQARSLSTSSISPA
ncbi:hypothetical protein AMAG_06251 [Allomyces macrogynus ATCC 38327]|uniref:Uncharacterized protein n=1 Tax=Allomyces macrogynus (strain ATCC 38327) TaxID=578462 RepID=A0A0L0SG32_ALLM3|nr:hypothetical protein AMAG_06251 [Allomyces macrogynus ATCC 38327]|eukprot:KNE61422.1 hypothetical protein AMAG_06251 [Allomyces macrogynus ATCC 38327]